MRHLELHKQSSFHSEPSIECGDCGRQFYTLKNLKRHKRMRHNENEIIMVCDICGKEFHSIDGLRNHKSLY